MSVDTFRTANKLDAEAIAQLVNKAYRPETGTTGWTHESDLVSGNRISVDQVAEVMSKPNSVIFVGLKGLDIMACVHVEKDGSNSHIGMLAVNPKLQGAGAGKQMLAHAERYANESFGSEKFIMVVLSSRSELIAFYLRRGYQKTGSIMDYPLSAGVGTPKHANLKIEVLEKLTKIAVQRDAPKVTCPSPLRSMSQAGAMLPDIINFDAIQWQSTLPGARFKAYREDGKQIRLVEFSSEFVEPDWCEKSHVGFVLEGTLEVDFKGRVLVYPQGSGIFIPQGSATAHKARSITPVVRLVLVEDV